MSFGLAHSAEPLNLKTSNSFDYGVDVSSYSYQEWINGTSFMKETGYRAGLSLGGTQVVGDSVFVRAETRFSYGKLKYSGVPADSKLTTRADCVLTCVCRLAAVVNHRSVPPADQFRNGGYT